METVLGLLVDPRIGVLARAEMGFSLMTQDVIGVTKIIREGTGRRFQIGSESVCVAVNSTVEFPVTWKLFDPILFSLTAICHGNTIMAGELYRTFKRETPSHVIRLPKTVDCTCPSLLWGHHPGCPLANRESRIL